MNEWLDSNSLWLVVAVAALIALVLIARWAGRGRTDGLEPTSQEKAERAKQMRGVGGDLENLMAEIEQMTKRLGAELDAKAVRLEKLLREADEKITRLESMPEANAVVTGQSSVEPPAQPDDPLARSVYALADKGMKAPDIARQLNEHVGKIELILALRSA